MARFVVVALLAATAAVVATSAPAASQRRPAGPDDGGVVAFDQVAGVDPGALSPMARDKLAHANRSRFVEIAATDVLSTLGSSTVDLELFPDLVLALDGDGPPARGQNGSTTWSGLAENGDYATLTFIDGKTIGTAAVGGVVYDISPVSGGKHLIVEEGRVFPDEAEPLTPDEAGGGQPVDGEGSDAVHPQPLPRLRPRPGLSSMC